MTTESGSFSSSKQKDIPRGYTRWKAFMQRNVKQGNQQQGKNKRSLEEN